MFRYQVINLWRALDTLLGSGSQADKLNKSINVNFSAHSEAHARLFSSNKTKNESRR